MDSKPLGPLSEPGNRLPENWRMGGPIGKQESFILILSWLVLLIGILMGIMAITSDLLDGMDADSAAIRRGTDPRPAWFGERPNLTDEQHAGIKPISEDEHSQIFGLRQHDTEDEVPFMELYCQVRRGVGFC